MEVKCFEIRDVATFIPVICIRPVPKNEEQRWLLRRDGYSGTPQEQCIIYINAQCRGAEYDPYNWPGPVTTHRIAHAYIQEHWHELVDGQVIDVEYILGKTAAPKVSERITDTL